MVRLDGSIFGLGSLFLRAEKWRLVGKGLGYSNFGFENFILWKGLKDLEIGILEERRRGEFGFYF